MLVHPEALLVLHRFVLVAPSFELVGPSLTVVFCVGLVVVVISLSMVAVVVIGGFAPPRLLFDLAPYRPPLENIRFGLQHAAQLFRFRFVQSLSVLLLFRPVLVLELTLAMAASLPEGGAMSTSPL